ncbi:MAG: hypothetical protein IKZ07_04400 [Akkermansia sp.]|nr:hypothetical protein [Akkermansia sp.]
MAHDTAFLGASTVLGQYWTKRRFFDYLINKDNFRLTFGKTFRMMVYLDNAVANGTENARNDVEADTKATNYLINHLADIKPEFTVFVTTCDMLAENADETTPTLTESDDPYVQNRINLYRELNRQYGRVLNVHLPEIASTTHSGFSKVVDVLKNPPTSGTLPLAPMEMHQLYFSQRILGDVEKCIPLGIPAIIPAMPPLTTTEIAEIIAPELLDRLPAFDSSQPMGSRRTSIHSFQWLDPKDGYLVTKEDQLELLKFYFAPDFV